MNEQILFERIILDWKKIWYSNSDNEKIPKESGIYQIYGDSPIYGTNTLLYIGQAQNLYKRVVKGHLINENSFITRQPNKSVRYALVPITYLNIVEKILIIMHKPSLNSSSLINIPLEAKNRGFYIQNHGERGLLNLEVTNFYFLQNQIKQ